MTNTLFSDDARLVLHFWEDRLDTQRPLWFCRYGCEVDDMPCNGVSAKADDLSLLRFCGDFFAQFPAVFVAIADKTIREFAADRLEEYCPRVRIILPADGAFRGSDSISDIIKTAGDQAGAALDRLCCGARERPVHGLLDLADVTRPTDCKPTVLSGFAEIDRDIGGFSAGEISVWTAKRGAGKSTLLSQIMLEAINQGHRVCAYSGELNAWRFKSWAILQAAGRCNAVPVTDANSGRTWYKPTAAASNAIDEWLRGNFFLYDNRAAGASEESKIMTAFELAVLRHGCDTFLVDNLMALDFHEEADRDFYRAQSNFVGRLSDFAKASNAHVHLVAHPRKFDNTRAIEADDIGGSSGISDRADNVFALTRLDEAAAQKEGYCSKLKVLKNRESGITATYSLDFEPISRRFYKHGSGDPDKRFGWEPAQAELAEVAADGREPF